MGVLRDFGLLNVIIHHRDPQKAHFLRKSASFKLSTVKIRWGVWPVGELTESVTDRHTHTEVNLYSVHAYPGVRDNRSTINTKTGYDDDALLTYLLYIGLTTSRYKLFTVAICECTLWVISLFELVFHWNQSII